MREIGIYIHVPFCKQKCSYCDFISFSNLDNKIEIYINAIQREIKNSKQVDNDFKISTVYIGGGTPSFINRKYITKILETIKEKYKDQLVQNPEVTIEINPGTLTKKKICDYKNAGINRISIGLQTTNDVLLKEIGRIHSYQDFKEAYEIIRNSGFENINVDLMLDLPNQTLDDLQKSLEKVLTYMPKHISVYSLIIEEGTKIAKQVECGELKLSDEDMERKMYWYVKEKLEENGYIHYEISNFAKNGYMSKHNLNCWNQEEYIGYGVAAHSYINEKRYSNTDDIEKYIYNIENERMEKNYEIHEIQTLDGKEKEYMMLGLRKIDGVDIEMYKRKFGINPMYLYENELDKLVKEKLLVIEENKIKLSDRGLDLANLVWEEFL